jgi:hypothetical protein
MVALSKEQKQQARAEYIKHATIILDGELALVKSQYESGYHLVHIENGKAIDCECGDFVYRSAYCKHREAVELRLAPKPAKVRKPRVISPLVAELQIPVGTKVRLVKGSLQKVSATCPADVSKVPAECQEDATPELSAEEEKLFQAIGDDPIILADEITDVEEWKAPASTQEQRERAPLNGQRGFSLLRV